MAFGLVLVSCGNANSDPAKGMVENTGPWSLDNDGSYVNYTTIKAGSIAEPNTFTSLTGSVSEDGTAEVTIILDSIHTNIDTRDVRMREFLFKTDQHTYAVITSQIDMAGLSGLEVGARAVQSIEINVALAGASNVYDADVFVTRAGPNTVSVETRAPILVKPDDFGVQADIDYLQELAGLPSITPVVPVNFSLLFEAFDA